MGWSVTPAIVAETKEEMSKIECDREKPVCIVSQTTFNYNKFQELVEIFKERGYDISIVNTICNATEERQTEAREIAAKVDAMIVIGGKRSSNTRKLYEICSRECANTCFIQTLDDLHLELPKSVRLVGITAGASTPNWVIDKVANWVRQTRQTHNRFSLPTFFYNGWKFFVKYSFYTAFAAMALAYVCMKLQGVRTDWKLLWFAWLFVFGLTSVNHAAEQAPTRVRNLSYILGFTACAGALVLYNPT